MSRLKKQDFISINDILISDVLKEFDLTDDQILNIAIEPKLGAAVNMLKEVMWEKWNMDTVTAMKVIEKLRAEFN